MISRREFLRNTALVTLGSMIPLNSMMSNPNNLQLLGIIDSIKKMNLSNHKIGEIVFKIAKTFVGKPYIGGTLDSQEFESLVYSLDGFDCVTFCETSLALARISKAQKFTVNAFESELTKIRYQNGRIDGYASRSHYSSEWIISNTKLGILKDLSKELNGHKFSTKVYFMSQNAHLYKSLKDNRDMINKIVTNENAVNDTERYFIAKSEVATIQSKIQTGDFILIATSKAGLDYSHLGIAYRNSKNKLCIMHASSNKKEVIMDGELLDYLDKSKTTIGISVLRPL